MSNAIAADLTPREKLAAFANAQALPVLCTALLALDLKVNLDSAERLARGVMINAVCKKSLAADEAFSAWAESVDDDRTAVEVLVDAVEGI